MESQLKSFLSEYRSTRAFDPAKFVEEKTFKLFNYMKESGLDAIVVNLSGGIDSAVTLCLAYKAQQKYPDLIKHIEVINQPINSSQWSIDNAKSLTDKLKLPLKIINLDLEHKAVANRVSEATGLESTKYSLGQFKSYLRTTNAYYVTQLLGAKGYKSIVLGTGNKDEDGFLAYFCKAGDGVVDVQLIYDLHKSEVYQVAKYLEVPEQIIEQPPSADLWEGHSDEGELGLSYDEVEFYLAFRELKKETKKKFTGKLTEAELKQFNKIKDRCEEVHRKNKHKLNFPINL